MTPAAYNTDATAFQHTGTLYIVWFSMKMDVSTALQFMFSKMVNPYLTSPWIQETLCSSCKPAEYTTQHARLTSAL